MIGRLNELAAEFVKGYLDQLAAAENELTARELMEFCFKAGYVAGRDQAESDAGQSYAEEFSGA